MAEYCFAQYIPDPDGPGRVPDLPRGIDFAMLAEVPGGAWSLFSASSEGEEPWQPKNCVDEELRILLISGEGYPPALALAREDMKVQLPTAAASPEAFSAAYKPILDARLRAQSASTHVLAKCLKDEGPYKSVGEWVWVIGAAADSAETVRWVSSDFFVYADPASDFELSEAQREALLGHPQRE